MRREGSAGGQALARHFEPFDALERPSTPHPETLEVGFQHIGVTLGLQADVEWRYDPDQNQVQFLDYRPPCETLIVASYVEAGP